MGFDHSGLRAVGAVRIAPGTKKFLVSPVFLKKAAETHQRVREAVRAGGMGCFKNKGDDLRLPPLYLAALLSLQMCESVSLYGVTVGGGSHQFAGKVCVLCARAPQRERAELPQLVMRMAGLGAPGRACQPADPNNHRLNSPTASPRRTRESEHRVSGAHPQSSLCCWVAGVSRQTLPSATAAQRHVARVLLLPSAGGLHYGERAVRRGLAAIRAAIPPGQRPVAHIRLTSQQIDTPRT